MFVCFFFLEKKVDGVGGGGGGDWKENLLYLSTLLRCPSQWNETPVTGLQRLSEVQGASFTVYIVWV